MDRFMRLAGGIPIVDGVGYSCPRFRAEAETWQRILSIAIVLETNQLPQKSELLQISATPGTNGEMEI